MSLLSDSDVEIRDEGGSSPRSVTGKVSETVEFTHSMPAYMKGGGGGCGREPDSRNPRLDLKEFFEGNSHVVPGLFKQELLENYAPQPGLP